jgi:hypothetical protein
MISRNLSTQPEGNECRVARSPKSTALGFEESSTGFTLRADFLSLHQSVAGTAERFSECACEEPLEVTDDGRVRKGYITNQDSVDEMLDDA